MSRPSHWLSLWFLALGLGLWSLGAFGGGPTRVVPVKSAVLQHSGWQALEPALATWRGQVVDHFGWPVLGAEILGPKGEHTLSDGEGRFALEIRGGGQQRLSAQAKGHGTASARGLCADPVSLVLGPAVPWLKGPQQNGSQQKGPGRLQARQEILLAGEGELVDGAGKEIAGGRVSVMETGDTVLADEFGRFRLPLPTGPCHLLAYDGVGRIGEMAFRPSRPQGVLPLGKIELEDGLDLVGVLRNTQDGPCAKATMLLRYGGMQRQELTDAAGHFAFRGLVQGQYVLEAQPHRGDLGFRESIDLSSDYDADYAMRPARSLRLQVMDGRKSPRPLVHVVAEEAGLPSAYARADEAGRVLLEGLGEGPYDFDVRDGDLGELAVLSFDEELGQLLVGDGAVAAKER